MARQLKILALAVVLAAVGTFAIGRALSSEGTDPKVRAANLASQGAAEIERVLDQARAVLDDLASRRAVEYLFHLNDEHTHDDDNVTHVDRVQDREFEQRNRQCRRAMARALEANPEFIAFGRASDAVYGRADCLAADPPLDGPLDVGDRGFYLDAAAQRGFVVGDYQLNGVRGVRSIGMGRPIDPEWPRETGILFAWLPLDMLDSTLDRLVWPEQYDLVVVDRNGTVLERPLLQYEVGTSIADTELGRAILTGAGDGFEAEVEGVRRVYGFAEPASAQGRIMVAVGLPVGD